MEVSPRKLNPPGSWKTWPFIRGIFNFFDAQIVGVKALLRSADLAPDEMQEEPSKFDKWLEKKLGSEAFQKAIVGIAVAMGLLLSIGLFFLCLIIPLLVFVGTISSGFTKAHFKRTTLGNQMTEYIYGMKNFIHDFSNLSEATQNELVLWDDYLVYAVVLEENQQIVNDIIKRRKSL